MELRVVAGDILQIEADAALVNLFEGVERPGGATGAVDKALDGIITKLISEGEIRGKLGEVVEIHTFGKIKPARVLVLGLGKQADFDLGKIRYALAEGARALRKIGIKRAATILHGAGAGGISPEAAAQMIAEGVLLGLYRYREFKSPEDEREPQELLIVVRDPEQVRAVEEGVRRGRILAEATNFARDLANKPGSILTPGALAEEARKMASELGFSCEILEREDMEKLGMGALLGVARGSHEPPKFIVLEYSGDPDSPSKISLVGKGITFDSGGLSLKSQEHMKGMHNDMGGAAAILGAMKAIGELRPEVNVLALIPAAENMPGGGALKPGDILKAMNGKTIEVENTDAEGRMILADALCYARRRGAAEIIDVATLTGACHIALGDLCAGAFTNSQKLLEEVKEAASEAGEKIWELPMIEEYKEQIRSEVADIKNTGGRYGGAITAAQFLAFFVEDTPWVHLDIAGPVRSEKERGPLVKGATGVMTRTLANFLLRRSRKEGR